MKTNSYSRASLQPCSTGIVDIHYGDILVNYDCCFSIDTHTLPTLKDPSLADVYRNDLLMDGDIVIADTAEDQTAGKCVELFDVGNRKVLAGLHTIAVRGRIKFGTGYLGYYLSSPAYRKQLLPQMQGTKVISISKTALTNTVIASPCLAEQTAIGALLRKLDVLIAAEKRKLILLRDKKSALLSQILDRKMRFKGYTDPWEQCKLGEIAEIGTGSHNTQDGHLDGHFPFFIRSDQKLFLDYYDYDEEAILIPGDGRIGQIYHYMNGKYALHQRVYRIKVNSSVDTRFILYLMEACFRKHALAMNSQGTVPSLRKPIFTEWSIGLPGDRDEQIKISKLFNQLDNLIDAESQKVDLLELKKKALLQQMFI